MEHAIETRLFAIHHLATRRHAVLGTGIAANLPVEFAGVDVHIARAALGGVSELRAKLLSKVLSMHRVVSSSGART
jgi:hypothetical protein